MNVIVLLLAVFIVGCNRIVNNDPAGTWIGQTAGEARPGLPGSFRETWTFQDGQITTDRDTTYTYKCDATTEPKQIDITSHSPGGGEQVRMAIYKIENDTLTISELIPNRAKAGARRPEDFYPKERTDVITLTFRKKK